MIRDEHIETVLTVKEMLSGGGGYFHESMAPRIGGSAHGTLAPIDRLHTFAAIDWSVGDVVEGKVAPYNLTVVPIAVLDGSIETMKIFVEQKYDYINDRFRDVLTPKTIDALLEAWACGWHEEMSEL